MKVLITGATGWLGQAALQAVKKIFPEVSKNDLYLYASRERLHSDPSYGVVKINELTSSKNLPQNLDLFVALALKTRDYAQKMGKYEYLEINEKLIHKHIELLESTNPKNVVLISSGVVSKFFEGTGALDSYTEIKLLEEKLFNEFAKKTNAKLIVLRLWGATGELMTEPLKYAIGNLIYQAETSDQIVIDSEFEVYRRYIDATQMFEVLIHALQKNVSATLNSGGVTVEIGALAELISSKHKKTKRIVRHLDLTREPDLYIPTDSDFDNLANSLGISILGLQDQVALTTKSVKQAMKNRT